MLHRRVRISLAVLLAATLACSLSNAQPSPTASPAAPPTETQNAPATQAVRDTQMAGTQAAEAEAAAATATQSFSLTATPARATVVAANRQATRVAGTSTAIAHSTQQAQSMYDRVQELKAEGYLTRADGEFQVIPAFNESWAQLGWYQWWDTGLSPKNFVVRADASWESGSDRADWWNSGCGFVFRALDNDNHYLAFLALDGRVYMSAFKRGAFVDLGSNYYGKVGTLEGEAELMLMVVDDKFTFFVDGERVYTRTDRSFTEGALALTLLSGTNKDFGTRCRMLNIELWELQ